MTEVITTTETKLVPAAKEGGQDGGVAGAQKKDARSKLRSSSKLKR